MQVTSRTDILGPVDKTHVIRPSTHSLYLSLKSSNSTHTHTQTHSDLKKGRSCPSVLSRHRLELTDLTSYEKQLSPDHLNAINFY